MQPRQQTSNSLKSGNTSKQQRVKPMLQTWNMRSCVTYLRNLCRQLAPGNVRAGPAKAPHECGKGRGIRAPVSLLTSTLCRVGPDQKKKKSGPSTTSSPKTCTHPNLPKDTSHTTTIPRTAQPRTTLTEPTRCRHVRPCIRRTPGGSGTIPNLSSTKDSARQLPPYCPKPHPIQHRVRV